MRYMHRKLAQEQSLQLRMYGTDYLQVDEITTTSSAINLHVQSMSRYLHFNSDNYVDNYVQLAV